MYIGKLKGVSRSNASAVQGATKIFEPSLNSLSYMYTYIHYIYIYIYIYIYTYITLRITPRMLLVGHSGFNDASPYPDEDAADIDKHR